MNNLGYLTGAEYKAIRKLLGFSQDEAKTFHGCKNISTIQRWEREYSRTSVFACDKITNLLTEINQRIKKEVEKACNLPKNQEVVLITYSEVCINKYVYNLGEIPASVYNTMICRIYHEIVENGHPCGVVEMNENDYTDFLEAQNLTDCQSNREKWAVYYRNKILND